MQATWVVDVFLTGEHECLYNQALADIRLIGAGIKCLYCTIKYSTIHASVRTGLGGIRLLFITKRYGPGENIYFVFLSHRNEMCLVTKLVKVGVYGFVICHFDLECDSCKYSQRMVSEGKNTLLHVLLNVKVPVTLNEH